MPDNFVIVYDFPTFWKFYKRKVGKKSAERAFNNLTKKKQIACINGLINGYNIQIELHKTELRFIKHPLTFINGENWEDEFDITPQKQSLQANDFKMDAVGSARMGWCTKCNKSDFYDKFTVHQDISKCCGWDLVPKKVQ